MTNNAPSQRQRVTELFRSVGPGSPTLLPGWDCAMLAAHLVLRERRPDAALGILVPFLAGHTERVQRRLASRPWEDLCSLVASGPPRLHPARWSRRFAEAADLVEFYVHGEDIRRAQAARQPATVPAADEDAFWTRLRALSRVVFRSHPMAVVLQRESGERISAGKQPAAVPQPAADAVTVSGLPSELLLHAFGRDRSDPSVARVTVAGDERALSAYAELGRGL